MTAHYALRNTQVIVCEDAIGQVTLLYKTKSLEFSVFHKQEHQAEIVDTQEVDRVLQNLPTAHKPTPDHPWRKPLFSNRNPTPSSP